MSAETQHRPRVGVPWRTIAEQATNNRYRYDDYLRAVREAGGRPVEVSLSLAPPEVERLAATLDAVLLPGSPADVNPQLYGESRLEECVEPDPQRERIDYALLKHAFTNRKPVLTICYGTQLLNVYLGGTLIQDIPRELRTEIRHSRKGLPPGAEDPYHAAQLVAGCRLARLAGATEVTVNSSHHQAIHQPGRGLREVAHAPDGVIEAVEWTGDATWVMGVQWHPERMRGDPLATALFSELVAAARTAAALH